MRRLRKWDRDEMRAMGYSRKALFGLFDRPEGQAPWMVGLYHGKPVCVFGHDTTNFLNYFMFLGTDEVTANIKLFTQFARRYIDLVSADYPWLRSVVSVWEHHAQSRAWLRLLGFEDTGAVIFHADNRFVLVERRFK
jgi:hypothetical protein